MAIEERSKSSPSSPIEALCKDLELVSGSDDKNLSAKVLEIYFVRNPKVQVSENSKKLAEDVAAGVSPAVEPGILPGGTKSPEFQVRPLISGRQDARPPRQVRHLPLQAQDPIAPRSKAYVRSG